jgi:hypothetical protein
VYNLTYITTSHWELSSKVAVDISNEYRMERRREVKPNYIYHVRDKID